MYYCTYVMTGRSKTFSGKTAKEIHRKFLLDYGEAENDVRKIEIFKEDPTNVSIYEIDTFGNDFGLVISYSLFKSKLVSNKWSFEQINAMLKKGTIH